MKNRGKGIVLSYIYTISNTIIGLFISAYILRMLGQTDYGVYQTMTSFISYLSLFELGTGTIMTRNISLCKKDGSEKDLIQKNISTVWSIALILSFIILFVATIFFCLIDYIYSNSLTSVQRDTGKILFIFIVVKLLFSFANQTLNGVMLGFEEYSIQTIVSLIHLFTRTLIVVVALFFMHSSILLVSIDMVLSIVVFIYTFIFCRKRFGIKFSFKYFDILTFKLILPLAFAMFLQTVVNMANNNVDKFVIGVVMTPEDVSVYSIGMFIFSTFSALTTIPISMYMPKIALEMRAGLKGVELTKSLIQPSRLISIIGGLVLFGFISVGRQFIVIVYGEEYILAWLIAVIVMIPMYINMTSGVLVNVLDVLRKRHVRSICLGITAVGNIILTIWWIYVWGMIGAAIATAICTILGQIVLMNIYYSKKIEIPIIYLYRQSFKGILIPLFVSCFGSFLLLNLSKNIYIQFVIGGFSFLVLFGCLFLAFGSNQYERNFLSGFMRKMFHK